MKKKKRIIVITIVFFLLILFVPIPTGVYKDGGTRTYTALTYKVVCWNRLVNENDKYTKTSLYFILDNFKDLDELWNIEQTKS